MRDITSLHVFVGGIVTLILLLHERTRFVAALIVFVVTVIARADLVGVDLRFWD